MTVGIATAAATNTNPNPPLGSPVEVIDGHHVVTLSAALLARRQTLTAELPDGWRTLPDHLRLRAAD